MLFRLPTSFLSIVVALLLVGASRPAVAQASSFEELQAAYIFNFAKYVQWPEQRSSFVIGVYGEQEIMIFLKKAFGDKRIGGKPVEIRWLEGSGDIQQCNIVYVPESGSKHIRLVVSETSRRNILIVSEEDLIKRGAAISFVVEDDRLKFKLKESALTEAGLTASQGLLKLAILQ